METREASTQGWRFGIFEVDAQSLEVRRNGTRVKLREQSFRILVLLLERAGDIVTREELRERLWPSDTWVDFDHSLNTAVMKLRDALGDSADKPLYIETIPKRGYRFVAPASVRLNAPIELVGPGAGNAASTSDLDAVPSAADRTMDTDVPLLAAVGTPVPVVSPAQAALAGAPTSKRFRWLQIFFIAISLAAVGAGVLWFFHRRLTTNQPRVEQRVTSNSSEAPIKSAVVSPDGKYLAYSDPTGLYLRVIATGETRRWAVPKDFVADATSWFPDGTHLLVVRFEGPMQKPSLWKLSLLGASPRKLIDNAGPGLVSPDGSRIVFFAAPEWGRELWVWGPELWVMNSDGSNPHKIAVARESEQPSSRESEIVAFAWSPNGQRIAYIERYVAPTAYPVDDVLFSLRTRDANGGDLRVILDDNRLRQALAWAPDGRILFSYQEDAMSDRSDESVRSIRVDQHTGKATGELHVLTNGLGSIGGTIGWMSLSSDGMRLVLSRNNSRVQSFIAEFEADTRKWKTLRLLTLDANKNAAEAWLPDNRTVLFVSNRNGRWTLFKQAMDETTAEVLVEQRCISLPRLSADGSQVMYQLRTCPEKFSAPVSLMRLPVAGGPPQLAMREPGILNYQCARLPSTLCIFSKVQGTDHVYVSFDPQRGIGRELLRTKGGPNNWSLSPDGRTLAVFPGDHRIRFFSLENGVAHEANTVTLNDWWIHNGDWNADSKGVLIPSVTPNGTPVILEVDRAGKASVVLEGAASTAFGWMVPSPDGRHGILAVEVPGDNNAWMIDTF